MASRTKRNRRRAVARTSAAEPTVSEKVVAVEPDEPATALSSGGLTNLGRSDVIGAGATTIAAAALFMTTFSTHVALGDAPESVSGVKTLGVLHAPGYPSYVATAAAFSKLFAVGGLAARVNGFSLVCAAFTIGAIYLLARNFGASPAGAVLGGLMLASSASFWFNADFAKHYSLSALLITLAALAGARWESGGRAILLIVAGALLGACAGASWEIALIMTVALATLMVFGTRRVGWALIAGSLAAVAIVATAAYAFLMWRASRHPAVNWGEVTNLNRLVEQVSQRDLSGGVVPGSANPVTNLVTRGPVLVANIARDIGLGGVLVALCGAFFGWRRLGRGRKLFLVVLVVLNLVTVAVATGVAHVEGFLTVVVAGGFLLDLLVALAVVVAVGFEPLVQRLSELATSARTPRRYQSGRARDGTRFRSEIAIALFVIVLAPSVLVHYAVADHRQAPYADRYGHRVLAELPRHAVLVVYQNDLTFPVVYRQTVFHDRPDVDLIVTTSLQLGWYREQVARTLHVPALLHTGPRERQVETLIKELQRTRSVFVDATAMILYPSIHVRLRGLVGEVVQSRDDASIDRDALANELIRADRADGIAGHHDVRFPNLIVEYVYARAHVRLAKQYAVAGQLGPATTELVRALDDAPFDSRTALVLRFARQRGEKPADVVFAIQSI